MEKTYTFIIPCRNEEKYIEKCLDSILELTYPKEKVYVIISDGMSTDSTVEKVKQYTTKFKNFLLHINQNQSAPYAFNFGIENANTDVLIILGAHSEADSDYLNACNKAFLMDENLGCVGGVLENIFEDTNSKAIGSAMSSAFGVGNASFRTGNFEGLVDTVAFGAYDLKVFKEIGSFDTSLTRNQDDELNYRLKKFGYKIWLSKAIKSRYYVRASFGKLWRQYYQYGYWKVFVNKKHKTITTIRQMIPFLFVLFLFFSLIMGVVFPISLYLSLPTLALYFVLAIIMALRFKSNRTFLIVFSFIILHLSYGLGYIEGVFQFLVLNKTPSKKSEKLSR